MEDDYDDDEIMDGIGVLNCTIEYGRLVCIAKYEDKGTGSIAIDICLKRKNLSIATS